MSLLGQTNCPVLRAVSKTTLGYNQISKTVFDPEYARIESLQGYDCIARYYFRPGEYDSDEDE